MAAHMVTPSDASAATSAVARTSGEPACIAIQTRSAAPAHAFPAGRELLTEEQLACERPLLGMMDSVMG
jgi:hypothetical protein